MSAAAHPYLEHNTVRCYERATALVAERFDLAAVHHGRPLPEGMDAWSVGSYPKDSSYGCVDTPTGRKHVYPGDFIVVYRSPGLRNPTYDVFKPDEFLRRFEPFPTVTQKGE